MRSTVHPFVLFAICYSTACADAPVPAKAPPSAPVREREEAAPVEPLSADEVLFSLRGKREDASRCFSKAGGERGYVSVAWVVDTEGAVREPEVARSTLGSNAVEDCLLDLVNGLRFTNQPALSSASWTFVRGLGDDAVLERAEGREKRSSKRRSRAAGRGTGVALEAASPGRVELSEVESVAENGYRLYAFCMREGLGRDIELNGRVMLSFTVGRTGEVVEVADAGSDLSDPGVIDCVAEAFYAMRFPEPRGGNARLRYSILLNED